MKNPLQAMRIGCCAIGLAASVAAHAGTAPPTTNNIPQNSLAYVYVTHVPVSTTLKYTNIIQCTTTTNDSASWQSLDTMVATEANYIYIDDYAPNGAEHPPRFYRVVEIPPTTVPPPSVPNSMVLITNGSFTMGQPGATAGNGPEHTVQVSAFFMDMNLVSYTVWTNVYRWAITHGYTFGHAGSGKGTTHPVHTVDWYDAVKWCNARSEMSAAMGGAVLTPCYYTDASKTTVYRTGTIDLASNCVDWSANGYRLPTEAEWERAARGGANGFRFPWAGNTISQKQANYFGNTLNYDYDQGPTGYNKTYASGGKPYSNPVGAFAPNAYGLYDMAGNVEEWCWDRYSRYFYQATLSTDPQGASTGTDRTARGGCWQMLAASATCFARDSQKPTTAVYTIGLRCVRTTQ